MAVVDEVVPRRQWTKERSLKCRFVFNSNEKNYNIVVKKKFTSNGFGLRIYIGVTKNTLRKRTPVRNVNKKISMYRNMCEGT